MRIYLSSAGVAYNCIVFLGLRFLRLPRLGQLSGLYGPEAKTCTALMIALALLSEGDTQLKSLIERTFKGDSSPGGDFS